MLRTPKSARADVMAGTVWDLQRNRMVPYLDCIGLDAWAKKYADVKFELVAIGTRSALAEMERLTIATPESFAYSVRPPSMVLLSPGDLQQSGVNITLYK